MGSNELSKDPGVVWPSHDETRKHYGAMAFDGKRYALITDISLSVKQEDDASHSYTICWAYLYQHFH